MELLFAQVAQNFGQAVAWFGTTKASRRFGRRNIA